MFAFFNCSSSSSFWFNGGLLISCYPGTIIDSGYSGTKVDPVALKGIKLGAHSDSHLFSLSSWIYGQRTPQVGATCLVVELSLGKLTKCMWFLLTHLVFPKKFIAWFDYLIISLNFWFSREFFKFEVWESKDFCVLLKSVKSFFEILCMIVSSPNLLRFLILIYFLNATKADIYPWTCYCRSKIISLNADFCFNSDSQWLFLSFNCCNCWGIFNVSLM